MDIVVELRNSYKERRIEFKSKIVLILKKNSSSSVDSAYCGHL